MLQSHLVEKPHIVIVDNLESADDVNALLPFLVDLADPSKVLVACRQAVADDAVVHVRLRPLAKEDAVALLRHECQLRDPGLAAAASDEQFERIYTVVGGNPMALKLVVGQILALSLDETLAILSQIEDEEVDELYTDIFLRSWHTLDEQAQALFAVMPLIYNGTRQQVAALTSLTRTEVNAALRRLERLLLIEVDGALEERRYRIHRLTETFLLKQIVGWQTGAGAGEQAPGFREALIRNVDYWGQWLSIHGREPASLDRERGAILRAFDFALDEPDAWPSVHAMIEAFTAYMERRGHWAEWTQVLERAIAAARNNRNEEDLPALLVLYARLLRLMSRHSDSIRCYRTAIRAGRRGGDRYNEARACTNLGYHFVEAGKLSRAEVLCNHALFIFEALKSEHGLAHTHNHLGIIYTRKGEWQAAEQHLNQATEIWFSMQDDHGRLMCTINLSLLNHEMKQYDRAIQYGVDALSLARSMNAEPTMAQIFVNLASTRNAMCEYDEAVRLINQAQSIYQRFGSLHGLTFVEHHLGSIYLSQGRLNDAETHLLAALDGWRAFGNSLHEGGALIRLARHAWLLNDAEQAIRKLAMADEALRHSQADMRLQELQNEMRDLRQAIAAGQP